MGRVRWYMQRGYSFGSMNSDHAGASSPSRTPGSARTKVSARSCRPLSQGAEFQPEEDIESLKASGARLAQKYVCEALPAIAPAAVEVPFSCTIAGVAVRGIADI